MAPRWRRSLVGPTAADLALTQRFFVSDFVWGLFAVGVYLVAAVAIRRNNMVLGAVLVAANAAVFGWLAVTILGRVRSAGACAADGCSVAVR